MRAQVFHGPGDLRFEDLPIPEPKAGEIVVSRGSEPYTHEALRYGQPVPLQCVPTANGSLRCSPADGVTRPHSPSLQALSALVHEHVPALPRPLADERALAALQFITFMVAQRARIIDDEDDVQATAEQAFVDNLVEMAVGAITAAAPAASVSGP